MQSHGADLPEEARELLARIRNGGQLMARMIDDLLGLARTNRQHLVKERVDLSEIAREVLANLSAVETERRVDTVVGPDLICMADHGLLRVVMENLIGNAWKFTGKVSRARIEIGSCVIGGERAHFVRDNGTGFDMDHAGKLFGVFQRLHSRDDF